MGETSQDRGEFDVDCVAQEKQIDQQQQSNTRKPDTSQFFQQFRKFVCQSRSAEQKRADPRPGFIPFGHALFRHIHVVHGAAQRFQRQSE